MSKKYILITGNHNPVVWYTGLKGNLVSIRDETAGIVDVGDGIYVTIYYANGFVYAVSDGEIKEGNWYLYNEYQPIHATGLVGFHETVKDSCKKIVGSTDKTLILGFGILELKGTILTDDAKQQSFTDHIQTFPAIVNTVKEMFDTKDGKGINNPTKTTLAEGEDNTFWSRQHFKEKDAVPVVVTEDEKKYSLEDMRKCWNIAKNPRVLSFPNRNTTFEEYIQSLQSK